MPKPHAPLIVEIVYSEASIVAATMQCTFQGSVADDDTRLITLLSHNDAMTDREAAWDAVHEALPAGWTVGPPTYDPGVRGWSVTARSLAHSRHRPPQTVTGTGVDEIGRPACPGRPSPRRAAA